MVLLNTPIFLVHGFRGVTWMHLPLEYSLRISGFKNIYKISYPSSKCSISECLFIIANKIKALLDSPLDNFLVIGHSLGGLLSRDLYKEGLIPRICIMIASPQKSVYAAKLAMWKLPHKLASTILGKAGMDLTIPPEELIPPPCEYYTVSCGMPYHDNFDGMIMKDNMIIDISRNYHISNTHHSAILFDIRMVRHVINLIHPDNRTDNWV